MQRRRDRSDPLRRRLVGGRRGRAPGRRRVRRGRQPRPRLDEPGAGGRPDQPGGARAGRRARAPPGGAAQAQRLHPAVLPAVLRVLHARRLARDQGRRPLRHRAHPHRGPHGVASSRHPRRSRRVPAPAGFRGRTLTGPDVPRLRGDARRDHAGVDAPAGPTALAGRCFRGVRGLRRRRTRGAGHLPVRPPPGELPTARSGRGTDQRRVGHRRPRPRLRVRRPSAHRVDGTHPGAVSRPRRRAARARALHRRGRRVRQQRRGRPMALGLPADALPARRARRARHDRRDLRDRLHLGPLLRTPGCGRGGRRRTRCARWEPKAC